MKRNILIALLGLVVTGQLVFAQQANQNINVLPLPADPLAPDAHLLGDVYLQRQVEPTLVASTRNPDHLMAFFVDYRAVDIADDPGMGELQSVAQFFLTSVKNLFWRLFRPSKRGVLELPIQAAQTTGEAWIGCSRSYDGGLTWSGCFVPGGPFDSTPASLASPAHGFEAATDPVAWAAPCGYVHVAFIAFTRGGGSKMLVATYQDYNDVEGGDTWHYEYTTEVEVGNNSEHGIFIDKPFLIVDVDRQGSGDPCAHNIYCSYSTFNGQDKNGNFRSKITFAKSTDLGLTWDTDKLNPPYHQNQGTWMAIDPLDGEIYLFWRHFIDPEAILMMRSTNYGHTFPGQPRIVTGDLDLSTFDQLGIGTTTPGITDPVTDISFRANGFPTAAIGVDPVTQQRSVMVAWQERVDIDPGSSLFGKPDPQGSPRIMLLHSQNGGNTWFDANGSPSEERQAVDFGDRDHDPNLYPAPGFGALPQLRPSGPQVQPTLSCGGGRCMLTYLESRGIIGQDEQGGNEVIQPVDLSSTGFISGISREMDLRAALIDPTDGHLLSTTQVSRYTISASADFSDCAVLDAVFSPVDCQALGITQSETLDDVEMACSIELGDGLPPCRRRVHEPNIPQSAGGTTPFVGDYNFLIPAVQFVPAEAPLGWRWAILPEDVPYQAFHSIWGGDNRNVILPTELGPGQTYQYEAYQNYAGPGEGPSCINAGAKNTDTMTARVDAELIVSSPTTYKQLEDAPHTFVFSLTNGTNANRFYRLTITDGAESASFWSPAVGQPLDPPGNDTGEVELFPYSSTSKVVYVEQAAPGSAPVPIRVEVVEIASYGGPLVDEGANGAITFNLDSSNPVVSGLGDQEKLDPAIVGDVNISNPFAINPFAINPFAINPFAINTSPSNPFAINPFAINPFAINDSPYDPPADAPTIQQVVDTTWTLTAGDSDVASSYLAQVNIDNLEAYIGNPENPNYPDEEGPSYAFQLMIYKNSGYGGLDSCDPLDIPQDQMISNIVLDPANPFAINPFAINPFAINPFAINPFAINSAFTMAPSDGTQLGRETGSVQPNASHDDGTLKAPRAPDVVKVTLRAYPLVADPPFLFNPTEDPPSMTVVPVACDPDLPLRDDYISCNIARQGPDLIGVPASDLQDPLEVFLGIPFDFPGESLVWTLKNVGNKPAFAENRILSHGFYLSTDEIVELNVDGTPVDPAEDIHLPFDEISTRNPLPPLLPETPAGDNEEKFGPSALTIDGVAPGSFYLIHFVDRFQEVSETDEHNNQMAYPVIVSVPNTAPVALDNSIAAVEDTPFDGILQANDAEGDELTFTVIAEPVKGGVTITNTATGAYTYTPEQDENGVDSFTFQANDGEFPSNTATISITITAVNDPPVAEAGADQTAPEGASVSFNGSVTDVDQGDTHTYQWDFGDGASASGESVSHAYADNGTYTLTLTVTDTDDASDSDTAVVTVQNVAPLVDAGTGGSIDEGGTFSGSGSFSDPGADTWTATVDFGDGSGSSLLALAVDKSFNLSHQYAQEGIYEVTVAVSDDDGGSSSATAPVTVANVAPTASDQAVSTDEDTAISITLTASDVGVADTLVYSVVGGPTHGTLSGTAPDLTYMPIPNYDGGDSFTFKANDGIADSNIATVTITMNPINDPPVATRGLSVSGNEDTAISGQLSGNDEENDALTYAIVTDGSLGSAVVDSSTGAFTYTPNDNANGEDSFTFTVSDGTLTSDPAPVAITVISVNDPPVAVDDMANTDEDTAVTISVTANDSDVEDGTPSISSVSAVLNGGAIIDPDGTITFDPTPDFCDGEGGFTYTVADSEGETDTATVSVTVHCVADAPVASDGAVVTDEDTPIVGTLVASDADGDLLTYSMASGPSKGTVELNTATGAFIFTPIADENGVDGFSFKANDGNLDSNVATVVVTINPVNDAPEATVDFYTTGGNTFLTAAALGVLGNDSDVDGDVLTAVLDTDVSHGLLTLDSNGSFTYLPEPDYFGTDSFTYHAHDGALDSNVARVTIGVQFAFLGLLDPWRAHPIYTIKDGSAMPVRWQYLDPETSTIVESSAADPIVIVRGFTGNAEQCGDKDLENGYEDVKTPGNSTYQYHTRDDIHQLNWDTSGVREESGVDIFHIYVGSGLTGQLDGPFCVKVRK